MQNEKILKEHFAKEIRQSKISENLNICYNDKTQKLPTSV